MKERTQGQIKRVILIVTVLLLAGFGIMLYCEWRGNFPNTLYVCRKMLLAMPVFAILIGRAHALAGRGMSNREYAAQMFGGRNTSGSRKNDMDYARILAAVMVILTHACSMQADADAASWKTNLLLSCTGIGLVCNPLYVMISGSLLLSVKKEEALGTFYFKRFVKVVIPMVVYYVIFLCVSGQDQSDTAAKSGGGCFTDFSGCIRNRTALLAYLHIDLVVCDGAVYPGDGKKYERQFPYGFIFSDTGGRASGDLSAACRRADWFYDEPGKLGGRIYFRVYCYGTENKMDGENGVDLRSHIRSDRSSCSGSG